MLHSHERLRTRMPDRGGRAFASFAVLFLLVFPGFPTTETPDFDLLKLIVEERSLSSPRPLSDLYCMAPDGRYYDVHEIGATAAVAPLEAAGRLVTGGMSGRLKERASAFLVCLA